MDESRIIGRFEDEEKEIEIGWRITEFSDGGITYSKGNEMWSRIIHFYKEGKEIGFASIYGKVEDMQNISNVYAQNVYEELKEKGEVNFN